MKKCGNCGKQAYIQYEFGYLCLDCDIKHQDLLERRISEQERQYNHALDRMEEVSGIPISGRYPPRQKPIINHMPVTMTNKVSIEKSIIGAVNSGIVNQLDVSINSISQINDDGAKKIKEFAEAVLKENELEKNQKESIIQQLEFLTQQMSLKKESRNMAVVHTTINAIASTIAISAGLCTIWESLKPLFLQ